MMSYRLYAELKKKAGEVRQGVLEMGLRSHNNGTGAGHISPGFSCADVLTGLYYGNVLKHDPKNPKMEDRDRFILSKSHGCMSLFYILADRGYFDKKEIELFNSPGGILGSHPDITKVPGIEASAASLGMGVAVATGIASCGKYDKMDYNVYTLLGDGECNEGSVWESFMYAGTNGLDNFTAIIDNNRYGAIGLLEDCASLEPASDKFKAFGFATREIDGHEFIEILPALKEVPYERGKPSAIIANTNKGKGVSFMEKAYDAGSPIWHTRAPEGEEVDIARRDLEEAIREAEEEIAFYSGVTK
jgi:transketolase